MIISKAKIKTIINQSLKESAASDMFQKTLLKKAVDYVIETKSLALPYRFVLNHMFGNKKKLSNDDFTPEELIWLQNKLTTKLLSENAVILRIAALKSKGQLDLYEKTRKKYKVSVKEDGKIKFPLTYDDYGWGKDSSKAFESLTGDMSWSWANSLGASWWLYDPNNLNCTLYKEKYDWNAGEDQIYTLKRVLQKDWSAVPHGVIEWAFRNVAKNLNEFSVQIDFKLVELAKNQKIVRAGYGGIKTNKSFELPSQLSNEL